MIGTKICCSINLKQNVKKIWWVHYFRGLHPGSIEPPQNKTPQSPFPKYQIIFFWVHFCILLKIPAGGSRIGQKKQDVLGMSTKIKF